MLRVAVIIVKNTNLDFLYPFAHTELLLLLNIKENVLYFLIDC